jgi:hypothetical protein
MKRPAVAIVLGVLALGAAVALIQVRCGTTPDEPPAPPTVQRPRTRALPGPAVPTPPPSGSLSVRGRVLDAQGHPAAGAEVLATRDLPGESLSKLPCSESDPETPLSSIDCADAPEELLLGLIEEGRGSSPVLARTTAASDGTFSLDGLPEGTVELWAESPRGAALQPGVASGTEGVELILAKGVSLAGSVVDEAGTPLSDVQVTLFHEEHSRYFELRTGADGRFKVGPLPEGPYSLVASTPGLLPAYLSSVIQEEVEEIVLHPPRRISGQVLSAGQPAPGAKVRVAYTGHVAETDAQGRFSFEPFAPDTYELQAERDGQHALDQVEVTEEESEVHVTLNLGPPLYVEGTVRDDAGQPIAKAWIGVMSVSNVSLSQMAHTEADGRYRLGPLPSGTYSFSVEAEGYEDVISQEEPVSEGRGPLDFTLPRLVLVEGIVTDAEGQPLAEVVLQATSVQRKPVKRAPRRQEEEIGEAVQGAEEAELHDAVSDDKGRFALELPEPGRYVIEVGADDYLFTRVETDAPATGLRLVLHTGARLEGTVVDARGTPLEGVTLVVKHGAGEQQREVEAESDEAGRFSLGGLAPGTYGVQATYDRGGFAHRASRTVQVRGTETVDASLRLETGGSVSGIVVDGQGRPMADVEVWGFTAQEDYLAVSESDASVARTGPDGRFTVQHLGDGECRLRAVKPGYAQEASPDEEEPGLAWGASVLSRTGARDVRLVLRYQGRIRGRVTREDGTPVPRFSLNGDFIRAPDGRFSHEVEQAGTVELLFEAPGLARVARDVEVPPGEDVDMGDVRLEPGRTLRGRVVNSRTGAPVAGASVRVNLADDDPDSEEFQWASGVRTQPDGTFTLEQLRPRSIRLEVHHEDYTRHRQRVEPGEEPLEVRLHEGAVVQGTVRDREGRPVVARIRVVSLSRPVSRFHRYGQDGALQVETDEAGHYRANKLEPGDYVVSAHMDARDGEGRAPRFFTRRVSLPVNGQQVLDFVEQGGTASLRLHVNMNLKGQVNDLDFALVPGPVSAQAGAEELWGLTGNAAVAYSGRTPEGALIYEGLAAGRYTLLLLAEVEPGRYMAHREELDVAEGAQLVHQLSADWRPITSSR